MPTMKKLGIVALALIVLMAIASFFMSVLSVVFKIALLVLAIFGLVMLLRPEIKNGYRYSTAGKRQRQDERYNKKK